ncbi:YwqJ-related putative deaminase [Streptomyces sp. XD-27]|uniref:YwqJ-related putative deaminase n=1 Tax=Streptomyces sp. XD-27 TaxID=3062779 RepID=UPI0026F4135B|nr:YwqJ-related putative deaminase [Streptomyces sp. XD-27]WKX72915.1 YwqJ-related putative deaminase [Streptomyces sp. XD-27]
MSDIAFGVASSLLVQGSIYSQTNLTGEGTPDLHPAVREFFDALPVGLRESFIGYCAESALISDQMWALDETRTDGGWTTLDEAVPYFAGAVILSKLIREKGDPEHGRTTLPCRSCTALLERLGVEITRP